MTPERWLQLKQIFQSALERNPAERSAFLNQACACAGEGILKSSGRTNPNSRIWAFDVATGEKRQITDVDAVHPSWSPNGFRKLQPCNTRSELSDSARAYPNQSMGHQRKP